jgi:hypothetical protein
VYFKIPIAIMADKGKTYTEEEIKNMTPNYRGKPEKFDPARIGKMSPRPTRKNPRVGPKSSSVPAPTHLQTKSTPQKNESILTDAIFGTDVSVVEVAPRETFSANYKQLKLQRGELHLRIAVILH